MNNKITIDSKPFEILEDSDPQYLSDSVNKALERGYEPLWGGLVANTSQYGSMYSFMERHVIQAVILKDKKKFDAWVKKEKDLIIKAKEEAEAARKKSEKNEEKRVALQNKYYGKRVYFRPKKSRRAKGGKASIVFVQSSHNSFIQRGIIVPRGYVIKRDKVSRAIEADLEEITFLR